ncbi:hypothetical protein B0T25DRAFT_571681 [Lasiosphaeria hispida]|uniref:Uncharacterized protein n=1 Tax=Lasiosphaeria hispida TaxID=260671 RepID=A0AAJ0MAR1_9PEZI|nr:hypothetical protein B0T25DRAFT_571681 [Lasiosphaeria hispida]
MGCFSSKPSGDCHPREVTENHEKFVESLYNHQATSKFTDNEAKYWSAKTIRVKVDERAYIVEKASKLFVIAVITVQLPYVRDTLLKIVQFFRENGFTDETVQRLTNKTAQQYCLTLKSLTGSAIFTHQLMSSICADYQWKVLVPVFSTAIASYEFPGKTILPWSRDYDGGEGHGAFSRMYKGSPPPEYFAVKEILPPDPTEREKISQSFANEATTLQNMNKGHCDHIVRFITAFTRGDSNETKSYYLISNGLTGEACRTCLRSTLIQR